MAKKKKQNKSNAKEELVLTTEQPDFRVVGLYGPVDEEMCEEVIRSLLTFAYTGDDPIQLILSTAGGLATEMFAVYDIMRNVRGDRRLITLGLGKIMSAGVLLLASGTKGSRKIGKHCKVMIHGLKSDLMGYMPTIENDLEELKRIQKMYIKTLSKETNMSKKYIRELFDRKVDIYLTAEEAVELGIADEIV